jgi:hypothetical protein
MVGADLGANLEMAHVACHVKINPDPWITGNGMQ